jgi:hypothetical protein
MPSLQSPYACARDTCSPTSLSTLVARTRAPLFSYPYPLPPSGSPGAANPL